MSGSDLETQIDQLFHKSQLCKREKKCVSLSNGCFCSYLSTQSHALIETKLKDLAVVDVVRILAEGFFHQRVIEGVGYLFEICFDPDEICDEICVAAVLAYIFAV